MFGMRLALLAVVAVFTLRAESNPVMLLPLEEFLEDWAISKKFTIEVAEKMPAEHYDFKPTPEQMTFGQQMVHIAGTLMFRFAQLSGEKMKYDRFPDKVDKETAIRLLNEGFDYTLEKVRAMTAPQSEKMFGVKWRGRPEASGRQMIRGMFVHTAHHRGQAEMYMRLKGIKPPEYTF